jgi:hypothetical protein
MLNDLKAEFSQAYVRAIAHAAGYFVLEANRNMDSDGVDLTVFARTSVGNTIRSPRLDIQLKATAVQVTEDPIPFDVEAKNHVELCATDFQIPRILVVVYLPNDTPTSWVKATEEELVLRKCGYWISLMGQTPTSNSTTHRVRIPRSNCFHVAQLQDIMSRISSGGTP